MDDKFLQAIEAFNMIKEEEDDDDEEIKEHICEHKSVFIEDHLTICNDCGEELNRQMVYQHEWSSFKQKETGINTNKMRVKKRTIIERDIYKDIDKFEFAHDISSFGNLIYNDVTNGKIFRGNSRKFIVFGCIYHSYNHHNRYKNIEVLATTFGISKKNALKGLRFINLNLTKSMSIISIFITPLSLFDDILNKFKASETQKADVIDLYNKIKNRSSLLNRSRPMSVAAGIVWYWIVLRGIKINIKEYSKKVGLSDMTIIKINREIVKIVV